MQQKNNLAINLMNMFDSSSYKEFGEGFFINKPKMTGYYYIFKDIKKPKICLIVNTSAFKYPSITTKIDDYLFVIFNVSSLEEFLENLVPDYFSSFMEVIDNSLEKKNTRNLPYGYYLDENGEIKVDLKKADEVRRIYDMYIDVKSVREIASQMDTNFSDIRNILHDNEEYERMRPPIVSISKLKEVRELMAQNVRGGAVAKRTIEDEIADARRRRKQHNELRQQN